MINRIIREGNCAINIIGLVMCGGSSTRMGEDKSLLVYYDIPQRDHVFNILKTICGQVFLSCREEQFQSSLPALNDKKMYADCGPIAGILTAFDHFPNNDLLVAAIDYPFLKMQEMAEMLSLSQGKTIAFYNQDEDLYEPLLAYYSHSDVKILKDIYKEGGRSLQFFLKKQNALKFYPENINCLKSIDTNEGYIRTKYMIDAC